MRQIIVQGEAYGVNYNFECEEISRSAQEVVLTTTGNEKHEIRVATRYECSVIGQNDLPSGTVCAFHFDGEYVALAIYKETDKQVIITPHEY